MEEPAPSLERSRRESGERLVRPPRITVRTAVLGSLLLIITMVFFTLFGAYFATPVHPPDGHVLPHGSQPL